MWNIMKLLLPLCLAQAAVVSGLYLGTSVEFPATGFLQWVSPTGEDFCVSVNDARPNDFRDENSLYVNMRNSCQRKTIFSFDFVGNGYIIQAIDVRTSAANTANGWFLGVQNDLPTDNGGPGELRLMLHAEGGRAAVWDLTGMYDGRPVLQIADQFLPSVASTIGHYVGIADTPQRTSQSMYLAASADFDSSIKLYPIAEAPAV